MIHQECGSCGNALDIPDEYAGAKGRCAKCGATILVQSSPDAIAVEPSIPVETSPVSAGREESPPVKSKMLTMFGWCCFLVAAATGILARFEIISWRWSLLLMVVCIVYLLVDARKRRTPRNRTILWVVGAALVYYCVFPLYLFLRQGTRTFIAIPASLALTFVMAFALFAPSYTNDDEQSDQTAGMAKDTSQRLTDSKGASVSVTEVEQKLNIKFSRMAKFKVKGIYLGMNKSDAINIMKKLLGKENVGYDESNPGMVMLNGGGASSAPSAMMFAGDPLIGYAFQSDVVDRIFNAGALDFRSFAQQFIDNYNLGKMTAERDEHGSEYLIHRNKAGFSVQIFADKSMGVALIENAGKPSFN